MTASGALRSEHRVANGRGGGIPRRSEPRHEGGIGTMIAGES